MPGLAYSEAKYFSSEPNLLQGWLSERDSIRQSLKRLTLGYAGALIVLALLAVIMPAWLLGSTSRSALAARQLSEIDGQAAKEQQKDNELERLRVQAKLVSASQKAVIHSINRLLAVLNSKTDDLVIRKLRMEIVQDNLEVAGEAEAAHLTAANQFIQLMEEKGAGSQGVLSSARRSGIIGANGISFQFLSTGKAKP